MESKGINSPYVVAFISGLVLGLGCQSLTIYTEFDVSTSLWGLMLPIIVIALLFVIVQQLLQRFFGFKGFVISGDNGKGKRFPSYLIFFAGFFISSALTTIFTTIFIGGLPN